MQKTSALSATFLESQQTDQAFVAYSHAGTKDILSFQSNAYQFLHSLPDKPEEGFIIHPFKVSENNPIIWIPKTGEAPANRRSRSSRLSMQNLNHDQTKYTNFVREIQKQIQEGRIQKAIASRPYFADTAETWDISDYFQKLVHKYENAFTYLFSIPGIGTWCGATPELLIDAQGKNVQLASLAGTKTADQEWTSKEEEEQKFVTRYIESQLHKSGCHNIWPGKTETINAGAVQHLKNSITAELNHPQQLYTLVQALHPTPAVGGLPKAAAIEIILDKEAYDRKYYTGFLGPVSEQNTKLYVNLRCLEALGDSVCLYLGAGITAASDPDAEWQETKLKAKTLLSVLNE